MFPRKATDYGHSRRQGHVPDAQSYQAIADIRGEFPFAAACLRGWADRCRWHVGLFGLPDGTLIGGSGLSGTADRPDD